MANGYSMHRDKSLPSSQEVFFTLLCFLFCSLSSALELSFSTGLHSAVPGYLAMFGDYFSCHNWSGRGQRYCLIPHNAQKILLHQRPVRFQTLVVSRLRTPALGQPRPSFKYEFPRHVQLREGIHQQKKSHLCL